MKYGLIGARLGHSYSKIIHERLYGGPYELCLLPREEDARAFLAARAFAGINVTIPYKRLAMEYCDEIEPRAAAIGAVNTVVNRGGRLYGYNTDAAGFAYLARAHGVDFAGRTVLILGSGATRGTAAAVMREQGAARILTASRRPAGADELSYAAAAACGAQIVVNASPAGMYPDVESCLLDVAAMPRLEAVLDIVYNPFRTELLARAAEAGVPVTACGFEMLVAQAVYAAEYFTGQKFPEGEIGRLHGALKSELVNLVLVGMPSCGKTTLGRELAARLHRPFVDLDEEIAAAAGQSIPAIFAAEGEAGFRRREAAEAARWGMRSGLVISTGGGTVKDAHNRRVLRRNGFVLWVRRPLAQLDVGGGRPLSTSTAALAAMEAERRPAYAAAADAVLDNDTTLTAAADAAEKAFHEVFHS